MAINVSHINVAVNLSRGGGGGRVALISEII